MCAAAGCAVIAGLEPPPEGTATSSTSGHGGQGGAGGSTSHTGGGSTSNTGGGGSTTTGGGGGAGGSCDPGGAPVAIVGAQELPKAIAADADGIYWTTEGDGFNGVWKMDKPCGAPTMLATTDLREPIAIAADGGDNNVYWADSGRDDLPCDSNRDRVKRIKKDGTDAPNGGELVYSFCGEAESIALNTANVYWTRPGIASTNGRVQYSEKGNLGGIAIVDNMIYTPLRIVADDAAVYWTDSEQNSIMRYAGAPPVLDSFASVAAPRLIGLDADRVYWIDGVNLVTQERQSPSMLSVVAPNVGTVTAMAVEENLAGAVYIVDDAGSAIKKIEKGDGTVTTIASDQSSPGGIAVDGARVYWTRPSLGEIWTAPR
jgi:hypothetical protein